MELETKRKFEKVPSIDSNLLIPNLDSLHEQLSRKELNATHTTEATSVETQTDFVAVDIQDTVVVNEERSGSVSETGRNDKIHEDIILVWKPSYLENHFEMMYYLGFYLPKADDQCSPKYAMHLVSFLFTAALSILQGLGATKHYIVNDAERGSVFRYITIWYYFHSVLVSLYFLTLTVRGKIYGFFNTKSHQICKQKLKFSKFVIAVVLTSIVSSGHESSGLNLLIDGYDFKDVIENKAYHISKKLLIWSRENYTDKLTGIAENTWDAGYTSANLGLGFTNMIMEFVGWLQYYMIRDVMLMAALTLYSYSEVYKSFLKSIDNLDSSTLDKMWENYDALYKVSCEMESCFGTLFKLVHIDNWLFCAYFLLDSLEKDTEIDAAFVTNLLIVLKIVATYCLAAVANNTSSQFKRCLNNIKSSKKITHKLEDMELTLKLIHLEQKINNSPVGLGSGNFLITENYAFKFMGSVVSSFLFFMDSQKK